jgi:heptosyltransferase-2
MFLAGIPRRIGYDKKSGFLLTDRIPHTKQFGLKHETDYALDLLRYIGIEPKEKALYMPVDGKSEEKVRRIFAGNGLEGEGAVVVVHPGASCPSKRWPAANFARVADALTDRFKAKVIVIAGETEKDFGDETARLARNRCVNLSGETSLSDLASVFRRSRLLISNDSGPVHIACAVGTPVIAIFGRSDRGLSPARWAPAGAKDVFLHKDAGCDVCLAHNCKIGFRCLEAVSVEEVLAAAAKLLGG